MGIHQNTIKYYLAFLLIYAVAALLITGCGEDDELPYLVRG